MHQLAAAYGLSSQSFGSEPARHIDLFKVSRAKISQLQASRRACGMLQGLLGPATKHASCWDKKIGLEAAQQHLSLPAFPTILHDCMVNV